MKKLYVQPAEYDASIVEVTEYPSVAWCPGDEPGDSFYPLPSWVAGVRTDVDRSDFDWLSFVASCQEYGREHGLPDVPDDPDAWPDQTVVNLTPHSLDVADKNGDVIITIPPSGDPARVAQSDRCVYMLPVETTDGENGGVIPVYTGAYGDVVGLPEPKPGIIYVVSRIVRERVPDRSDLYSPGPLIRDGAGLPVSCKGLYR